jgi:hypothetical protein
MTTLARMWGRWKLLHLPKTIFDCSRSFVISDIFVFVPFPTIVRTLEWYPFSLIAQTFPKPNVGASHCGGIYELYVSFALEAQSTVLLSLLL